MFIKGNVCLDIMLGLGRYITRVMYVSDSNTILPFVDASTKFNDSMTSQPFSLK